MARLELATPLRRTRRHERGAHGRDVDLRRSLRRSLRTAGEPLAIARRQRRIQPRRLVMLCDISGSMEPYARAYLQFLVSAAGSGPRVEAFVFATRLTRRHARARGPQPRARAPACGRGGAGLVERHPHRRRAEGVQRPPRAPRDGARRGRGHPLRRLGARRPGAGGARDGAPRAARAPDRVGQPARERARVLDPGGRHEGGAAALRRAGQRPQLRRDGRGRRRDRRRRVRPPEPPLPVEDEETWASATPVPGSSVAMPSGDGPSRGKTTPGWSIGG